MLLSVQNLNISFETARGTLRAIEDLSFEIKAGETVGIVGESGCGKSITNLALMGLLPEQAQVTSKDILFENTSLPGLTKQQLRKLRGQQMAMIFQDPMSSLNPCFTVKKQIGEVLLRDGCPKEQLDEKIIDLLIQVGIPDPKTRLGAYPHELSGGMSQRVMIAMALAGNPKLLIADEPTTALDVTIQAQILKLLIKIQKQQNMAMILVTHDLGVVAQMADRILVMYAGSIVESGPTKEVLTRPKHPYTHGLLECLPQTHLSNIKTPLPSISGMVPDLIHRPSGCQLHPRCAYVKEDCKSVFPNLENLHGHAYRCLYPLGENP